MQHQPNLLERRARPFRRRSRRVPRYAPWLLVAPVLAIVFGLRVVPMLFSLFLAFTDLDFRQPLSEANNVGFDNFTAVLASADFQEAIQVTFVIVVPALILEMALGLGAALWLNKPAKSRKVTRAVMLVPYLLVPVVIGNFFRMFYSAQFGQLNYMLALMGLEPRAWLTDPNTVQWAVVAMEVWHTTPFVILLCLAGLASLSRETIEAALVDGANAIQRFRYVILPELLPILLAVFVLRGMDAIQLFDEVYVLTGGGPGRLTSVINLYLYQFGFRQFRLGQTSAAVTIIVVTFAVFGILFAVLRRRWLDAKVVESR